MTALSAFDVFANMFLMDEYHTWAGRMYLHLQAAKQLRAGMDRAIADASEWTRDIEWEDGEAPQRGVRAYGCPRARSGGSTRWVRPPVRSGPVPPGEPPMGLSNSS